LATRRRASNTSITGAVSDLQRRVRYLQAHTAPSRLSNQVVARTNIRPRAVDSDQLALRAVTNDQVAFDAIEQANLANNSVGRNEIIDGEVVRAKIGTGAVDADRLDTNSVTNSKIQNSAVTTAKLENAAVSSEKIGTSAVTAEKIRDGAVARSKIQDRAVGTSQVADSAIGSTQLDTNAVTNSKIGNGAVGTSKIADLSITNEKIAFGTITDSRITARSQANIVIGNLKSDPGLTYSTSQFGVRMGAAFGTGSTQVARGDHTHTASGPSTTVTIFGTQAAGANHTHTIRATTSTLEAKQNIQLHSSFDINKLLKLSLKKYKYKKQYRNLHKEFNREWMYGYIAEEVEAIGLEEIVAYDREGSPVGLDYSLLSALILELVKHQQGEIEYLKQEVEGLKNND